nr:helix-turn-helix domain-containing protein [Streptomyces xinghaiensis]
MTACGETERFAAFLRSLKDRSGMSYEALARKSGMSGSSLHRYCRGTSVPQDYGSLHRLAVACGAAPDELRTLHRLWALADAARERDAAGEREGDAAGERRGRETAGEPVRLGAAGQPGTRQPAERGRQSADWAGTAGSAEGARSAEAAAEADTGTAPVSDTGPVGGTGPAGGTEAGGGTAPSPKSGTEGDARPEDAPRTGTVPRTEDAPDNAAEHTGTAASRAPSAPSAPADDHRKERAPAASPGRRRIRAAVGVIAAALALSATAWTVATLTSSSGNGGSTGSTGEAAENGRRLLFTASCSPVVAMGQHDACAREVQQLLHAKGADIDVDGNFGPQTQRRVTAFQVLAGLKPNGVVGDATKKALYEQPVKMSVWPPEKVRRRIREVFTEAPDRAVVIADCQSFLDPLHILPNTNGSRNWGVFQISDIRLRDLGGTPRQALDPEWNIRAAKRLWDQHRDFRHWPHCDRVFTPSPEASDTAR